MVIFRTISAATHRRKLIRRVVLTAALGCFWATMPGDAFANPYDIPDIPDISHYHTESAADYIPTFGAGKSLQSSIVFRAPAPLNITCSGNSTAITCRGNIGKSIDEESTDNPACRKAQITIGTRYTASIQPITTPVLCRDPYSFSRLFTPRVLPVGSRIEYRGVECAISSTSQLICKHGPNGFAVTAQQSWAL